MDGEVQPTESLQHEQDLAGIDVRTYNIGVNLAGKPYGWNVDNVDASRCEIKLGGKIRIASYCSIIERELKKRVESYMNKWTRFEAPKLVDKLEAKLQKKIGEEVVIELMSF